MLEDLHWADATSLSLIPFLARALRPNPVAGLLRACGHNLRQGGGSGSLFEIGAGFAPREGRRPEERGMPAAPGCGPRYAPARDVDPRAVDNLVSRLRQKLEADPDAPQRLVTVWGSGYRFEPPA
mgnify:CR=1 FL=1